MRVIMPSSLRPSLALICPGFTSSFGAQPLRLPALERLLAYCQAGLTLSTYSTALDVWQCELLQLLNVEPSQYPSAPLTWLGAGGVGEPGAWLHADAVKLAVTAHGLSLERVSAWDASSLASVAALVREHLAALQMSWRSVGAQVFLHRRTPLSVHTVSTRHAACGELHELQPHGPDAAQLRRVMTELQMLLHEKLAYANAPNAIWLWGAGELPTLPAKELPPMWADDHYTRGVYSAHAANKCCLPLPESLHDLLDQTAAAQLVAVVGNRDLHELEARWFAPALHALHAGRLHSVAVYLDGWQMHAQRSLLRRVFARARPFAESMQLGESVV